VRLANTPPILFGFWDIVRFKRFPHGAKIADELTQSFTQGLPQPFRALGKFL
jgi:hypothetical protein